MPLSSRRVVASFALAALSCGAQAAAVFSLASGGTTLVRFDSATPSLVSTSPLSGATSTLSGLDFRPLKGLLYGYELASSNIFTVDTSSGVTTFVSKSTAPVVGSLLGIDFNPVVDRLRVVTNDDENRRINVTTGAANSDVTLFYAASDINAGKSPNVIDVGYTNNDNNAATATELFYIDYVQGTLVTAVGNPNLGQLRTVGTLGVPTSALLGFDVLTALNGSNIGFLSAATGAFDTLYTVNLMSGLATPVGPIGASGLFGLAVAPVPEPGSLALMAAAGIAAFGLRRRSVAKAATAAATGTA